MAVSDKRARELGQTKQTTKLKDTERNREAGERVRRKGEDDETATNTEMGMR